MAEYVLKRVDTTIKCFNNIYEGTTKGNDYE